MVQTVWCHPDKGMFTGRDDVSAGSSPPGGGQENVTQMWLQDGAQPINGVYVIEGPATIVEGRAPVQLLCTRTAQFGPGNKMIDIRKQTPRDEAVLKAIQRCDVIQARRDISIDECKKEAVKQQHLEEQQVRRNAVSVGSISPGPVAVMCSVWYGNA